MFWKRPKRYRKKTQREGEAREGFRLSVFFKSSTCWGRLILRTPHEVMGAADSCAGTGPRLADVIAIVRRPSENGNLHVDADSRATR